MSQIERKEKTGYRNLVDFSLLDDT